MSSHGKEEGVKKGDTPMECDLKGLFKSTVEETKLKEKYTDSSIWKKSFWDLYYQFRTPTTQAIKR